jgi:DNA-binding transcriptional LysR family regulator
MTIRGHQSPPDPARRPASVNARALQLDMASLWAFVQVCEAGSISAAAPLLGWSQPGLSQRIQLLERRLGHRLFHRTTSGVTPTADGCAVLPLAHIMLDVARQIRIELDRRSTQPQPGHRAPTQRPDDEV